MWWQAALEHRLASEGLQGRCDELEAELQSTKAAAEGVTQEMAALREARAEQERMAVDQNLQEARAGVGVRTGSGSL